MSDALTTTAPGDTTAVTPPVAPEVTPVVPSGSTTSTEVVPAERFNGLMSSFNRLQTESDARIAALEAEANSLRTAQETTDVTEPTTTPQTDPAIAALVEQNERLLATLNAQNAEAAKARVLAKYPDAAVFADMLVGDDEAALEAVAATITERLKPAAPASGETTPPAAPVTPAPAPTAPVVPAPAPTVPAGGVVAPVDGDANSRIVDIITRAAEGGRGGGPDAWREYLAAKADQTEAAGQLA